MAHAGSFAASLAKILILLRNEILLVSHAETRGLFFRFSALKEHA